MRFCQALFLKIWSDKILLFSAIFCPFTPLTTLKIKIWKNINSTCRYYSFTHEYCKWRSYDICFLRYGEWQTKFFVILPHYQPDESILKKIQKKKKKMPGDIIILHVCTKNYDHMMYESWDKVHEEWMDWQTDEWKHTSRFFW